MAWKNPFEGLYRKGAELLVRFLGEPPPRRVKEESSPGPFYDAYRAFQKIPGEILIVRLSPELAGKDADARSWLGTFHGVLGVHGPDFVGNWYIKVEPEKAFDAMGRFEGSPLVLSVRFSGDVVALRKRLQAEARS